MTRISHYRVEQEIGRGGMGVVYRAVDLRLERPVAIKVLPPEATTDPERRRRFILEARAVSALNHPNIVTIFEVDEEEGATFLVMELIDGRPLDRILGDGPLPLERSLDYAIQIASALEAAHAAGIVHRDIKPGNIVIARGGGSGPTSSSDRAKVLDFGLAKLVERSSEQETISVLATTPGTILGTVAYMSPEQAQGFPVDARSDIFSFGAVVFEMLSGRRPFAADSDVGLLTSILRDAPPSLRALRPGLPMELEAIVGRALHKDADARFQSMGELRAALMAVHARVTRPPDAVWRRPVVLVPVALALLAAAGVGAWKTIEARRARWASTEAVLEIERLQLSGRTMHAVRVADQAARYAPEEIARLREAWLPFILVSEPDGAQVEIKNYHDPDGPWEPVGMTPLRVRLPFAYYRARLSKPGYAPVEVSAQQGRDPVRLLPEGSTTPGMVFVPGGRVSIGIAPPVTLPDYWIDRLEVTNADFKRFVDAGGYRDPKYWTRPFVRDGRTLTFDEAVAGFRDATGQPGPSAWELGTFLEGQADHPVGGISWFEAAAYAAFAERTLPTLYHWYEAAGVDERHSDILQVSNFDGRGSARAGERVGLGPWGTLDMAGNVKEWCENAAVGSARRYILGGGWNEPSYRFMEPDAQDPWARAATFGLRLVKSLGDASAAAEPVGRVRPDPSTVVPVAAEELAIYRRFYDYDPTPLDARVEGVTDSPEWRKEKVSFAAAYGNERIPAYLYLPNNVRPPFQTIVFFPTAYARAVPTSASLDLGTFEFLLRSGRAVLYPVYQGTFERRSNVHDSPTGLRDMGVQWGKDVFRAVDYLASRPEIDMSRLAFYSLSMGAYFGPIPVALEPRIKLAIFVSGGLRYRVPPEVQPANFAPQVKVPVLLVNGKDDFGVSLDEQRRFFELIGTPEPHKKRVVLPGGHVPQDIRGIFREALGWLDKYFGPAR